MQEAAMLDSFVTLSAMLLDTNKHTVSLASAGHAPPFLYRKALDKFEEACARDIAGYPLGVGEGTPFEAATISLEPGDCIVQFTDGVPDARNRDDKDFGMERILGVLQSGPPTARDIGQRLINAVKQHAVGRKPHDDITIVCFGRQGP
jgi:sigma-B regulation protein RsbU (phosphoserine phosphatase)